MVVPGAGGGMSRQSTEGFRAVTLLHVILCSRHTSLRICPNPQNVQHRLNPAVHYGLSDDDTSAGASAVTDVPSAGVLSVGRLCRWGCQ